MNPPLLSVCLITYNHEEYIRQAIESVLMQKVNFKYELIIADDFSKDKTQNIILEYCEKYPDFIIPMLRQKNVGAANNFIELISTPRSKYISYLEGDDYWTDPLKLQKQVDFLEENDKFSLCFHNVNLLNLRHGRETITRMHNHLEKDVYVTEDILKQWFIPSSSILFRNYKDFKIPNWFNYCESGDIPLLLLLSLKGKIKYLDEIMGVYRLHDFGVSVTHYGYNKVISMIYIYQSFNIYSNYKYKNKIEEAIIYEIRKHLPEVKELELVKLKLNKCQLSLKSRIIKLLKRIIKNK